MIQRLGTSYMSFRANQIDSVRSDYNSLLAENNQIAQNQLNKVSDSTSANNTQIPMHGSVQESKGNKLNIIA